MRPETTTPLPDGELGCRHVDQADAPLLREAMAGGEHAMEALYDRHAPLGHPDLGRLARGRGP